MSQRQKQIEREFLRGEEIERRNRKKDAKKGSNNIIDINLLIKKILEYFKSHLKLYKSVAKIKQ